MSFSLNTVSKYWLNTRKQDPRTATMEQRCSSLERLWCHSNRLKVTRSVNTVKKNDDQDNFPPRVFSSQPLV